MLELVVSRYGLRDKLEIENIEHGRRLAESLSDEGVAYPLMIVDGDNVIVPYEVLQGKWCAEHLPVDEAKIVAGGGRRPERLQHGPTIQAPPSAGPPRDAPSE